MPSGIVGIVVSLMEWTYNKEERRKGFDSNDGNYRLIFPFKVSPKLDISPVWEAEPRRWYDSKRDSLPKAHGIFWSHIYLENEDNI